jgi:hypothetical protein
VLLRSIDNKMPAFISASSEQRQGILCCLQALAASLLCLGVQLLLGSPSQYATLDLSWTNKGTGRESPSESTLPTSFDGAAASFSLRLFMNAVTAACSKAAINGKHLVAILAERLSLTRIFALPGLDSPCISAIKQLTARSPRSDGLAIGKLAVATAESVSALALRLLPPNGSPEAQEVARLCSCPCACFVF